jgi:hypothetical protein
MNEYTADTLGRMIVELYMEDQGHRENMTNPNYKSIGTAIFIDKNGQLWNSQDFGTTGNPQKTVNKWFKKLKYKTAMKKYKALNKQIKSSNGWLSKKPIPSRIEFDHKRHTYYK